MTRPANGGSASLGDLLSLPIVTLEEITPPLNSIQTQISQLSDDLQTAIKNLVGDYNASSSSAGPAPSVAQINNRAAMQFGGLGAQSFFEATNVHTKVTRFFVDAFKAIDIAANALATNFSNTSLQYDGELGSISSTNYLSYTVWGVDDPANQAFLGLDPYTALVTDVIVAADNNSVVSAVMVNGPSPLTDLLTGAYRRLLARAESASITIPPKSGPGLDQPSAVWHARSLMEESIYRMYQAVNRVYTDWGNAVQHAFSTFKAAVTTAEQQLQPVIDLLTKPQSAASIFDLIQMISGSASPIAITQVGPNRILVSISGTDATAWNYDTDIWNALGTGMGQNMPYEQDVIDAIRAYCAEHGLTNPQVILAAHSLGGMVAQQIAEKGLFNVTQVVTYGSPVMGNPVPGVQYDIYEAQGDAIPLLSRYENPSLPGSLQDMASMFPNFQTNYEGFTNPFSWSGFKQDLSSTGRDIGATWDNAFSLVENAAGAEYLYQEMKSMGAYVPGDIKVGGREVPFGTIVSADPQSLLTGTPNTGTFPYSLLTEQSSAAKIAFMDPHHLYGNSVQNVSDLTTGALTVHSAYGQSRFLEGQQIYPDQRPIGSFLTNTEYFGMPNTPQTAQINQYMATHSSVGQLLSTVGK